MDKRNKRVSEATFFAGGGKLQRLDKNQESLDARMESIYKMFKQQESMERKSQHSTLRERDHFPVDPHREYFSNDRIKEELYSGGCIYEAIWHFIATNVEDLNKVDEIAMEISEIFIDAL